ncbi:MAG: PilZ domain-containing protein [Sandaracinaceae bacterium]
MSALIIGRFTPEQSEAIRMALARAGMERRTALDIASAKIELARQLPRLVFVDAAMIDVEELCRYVRGDAHLFGLMVVAIVPAPNDGSFKEAVAAGCDDVLPQGDLGGITRRAAALAHYDPTLRPPSDQGIAIVAHPEDHARRALGRTLRLGGFDVRFAKHGDELAHMLDPKPDLFVAAESLPPAGALHGIITLRSALRGEPVPSAIVASAREINELGEADELRRVAVIADSAPKDHVLFVANELLRPGVRNLRSSRRVLWDSMCAFRKAGQLHPVLGLSYNLSADGMYIRTLDPPARGSELWFELRPPHSTHAVHLRGQVVWVKPIGHGPGGLSPAGFGVHIDEHACPPADLAHYQECYGLLVEAPRLVA